MTFFSGGNGGTERGGEGPRTPQPAPGGARVPTPRPLCTPGARSLSLCHTSSPRRGLCVCAQSLQLRPALRDPVGRSLPGSAVRGIFQARILEWVAVPSSRGSSRPRDGTQVSCTEADALPPSLREGRGGVRTHVNLCRHSQRLQCWPQPSSEGLAAGSRVGERGAVSVSRTGSLWALREFSPSS